MKVSAKRQITLPIDLCLVANIDKGDEVASFVDRQGVISIVKKSMGAASGILKGTKINQNISDDESLLSAIN
jgi:bifunctional DNA-binding transcriptional regulator/antitoxin component of YhaV-PrlF toxin-antitoxin module